MSGLRTRAYRIKEKLKTRAEQARFGKCVVLLYHRVADLKTDPQLLAVSPDHFDAHLAALKKNYNPITVAQFEELIASGKKFPPRSVLITFDDGYVDNYENALPLLEKHGLQALFYISTGNLGTEREFWWDEAERLLLTGKFPVASEFSLLGGSLVSSKDHPLTPEKIYQEVLPMLRKILFAEREKQMDVLRKLSAATDPRPGYRSMSFEELENFARSKSVVVGAHTHNHPSLASLSKTEQEEEIKLSKDILEKKLARGISHFSYPFGNRDDYSRVTEEVCKQLGFTWVAANHPGIVTGRSSPISFRRFLVRNWSQEEFTHQLNSFFQYV